MATNYPGGPLSYTGVGAFTPPDFGAVNRAPTGNDSLNYTIGHLWLDTATSTVYMLVSLAAGVATWLPLGGAAGTLHTLTGDAGGAVGPDGMSNINILGGAGSGITVTGNPGTFTLSIAPSTAAGPLLVTLTGDSGGAVPGDVNQNINIIGDPGSGIMVVGNPGTNTLTITDANESLHTVTTMDATPTVLFSQLLGNSTGFFMFAEIIAEGATFLSVLCATASASGRVNAGGVAELAGPPNINVVHNSGTGNPTVDINFSGTTLRLMVTGEAGITYNWTARVNQIAI